MAIPKRPSEGKEDLLARGENPSEHATAIDALKTSIMANKNQDSAKVERQEKPDDTEALWQSERQKAMDESSDARLELADQIA